MNHASDGKSNISLPRNNATGSLYGTPTPQHQAPRSLNRPDSCYGIQHITTRKPTALIIFVTSEDTAVIQNPAIPGKKTALIRLRGVVTRGFQPLIQLC